MQFGQLRKSRAMVVRTGARLGSIMVPGLLLERGSCNQLVVQHMWKLPSRFSQNLLYELQQGGTICKEPGSQLGESDSAAGNLQQAQKCKLPTSHCVHTRDHCIAFVIYQAQAFATCCSTP